MMLPAHFGWYDRADQAEPTHDPGLDVACPICNVRVGRHAVRPIRTVSLSDGKRSYFYRVHRDCQDQASPDLVTDIESVAIDGVQ